MRYTIEIDVHDSIVKDSEIETEAYIRQEMGWLEDSGITLIDVNAKEGFIDLPSVLKDMTYEEGLEYLRSLNQDLAETARADETVTSAPNFTSEYRSGVEWNILYADAAHDEPISGRVVDARGQERVSIQPDGQAGEFSLVIEGDSYGSYDTFDEALDIANRHIHELPPWDQEGYIIHDLTGNEGIYSLGGADGKEYAANAFWSSEEPGYVNYGVFAVQDDQMEILISGFCNGYLTIEDCVRDLARDFTPFENPDIRFVAWCSQEFDTADEYREALEEGKLEKPIHIPLHDSTSGKEQTMSNEHQESKKTVLYKGIALEDLDKHVSMAHSRFTGTNEGVDYLTALFARDMKTLTPEQFEAMSALSSVGNMNYQICNGGLDQYYFNAMDEERAPFSDQDVAHLDKDAQVEMLRELHAFGCEVFPEKREDNDRLDRIINDFENSHYEEEGEILFDDVECDEGGYYEAEGGLFAPYDFDERYYQVNEHLETLMEAYAQFLDKSIEKELARDGKETFYFSFGTADFFPFKLGWVEVQAKDRAEACEMYSSHYPKREDLINAAFIYNGTEWKQANMDEGKPGQVCHRVITDWGPHREKAQEKSINEMTHEAKGRAAEKNAERFEAAKDRRSTDLER